VRIVTIRLGIDGNPNQLGYDLFDRPTKRIPREADQNVAVT
jgi:hypothetical protein